MKSYKLIIISDKILSENNINHSVLKENVSIKNISFLGKVKFYSYNKIETQISRLELISVDILSDDISKLVKSMKLDLQIKKFIIAKDNINLNVKELIPFLGESGRLLRKSQTSLKRKDHSRITRDVKRLRTIGLLPYMSRTGL